MDEGHDLSSNVAFSAQFLSALAAADTISRATSPGLPPPADALDDSKRYRTRTFAYFQLLPYPVEEEAERDAALQGILKQLYIAVKAQDFSPGALHWTRQLQGWLSLKFDMPRELRARLARLYFHLTLAPGLDNSAADRFSRMLVTLTRYVNFVWPLSHREYCKRNSY
ncbi:hypothetical protein F4810DRAFT_560611 [Camillea tinctor]|nr:hypothetical protein F4810DRAFT_560611 [Camillea tinctor]